MGNASESLIDYGLGRGYFIRGATKNQLPGAGRPARFFFIPEAILAMICLPVFDPGSATETLPEFARITQHKTALLVFKNH